MRLLYGLLAFAFLISSCNDADGNKENKTEETPVETPAKETVSFQGIYTGTTPCADCPGIYMVSEFYPDSTYYQTMTYIDRDTKATDSGKWKLQDSVITVSFQGDNSQDRYFKVMNDSSLRMLDADKNIITGELEKYYILQKKDTTINR